MSGISGAGMSPGLLYAQQVQQMINNDSSQQLRQSGAETSARPSEPLPAQGQPEPRPAPAQTKVLAPVETGRIDFYA